MSNTIISIIKNRKINKNNINERMKNLYSCLHNKDHKQMKTYIKLYNRAYPDKKLKLEEIENLNLENYSTMTKSQYEKSRDFYLQQMRLEIENPNAKIDELVERREFLKSKEIILSSVSLPVIISAVFTIISLIADNFIIPDALIIYNSITNQLLQSLFTAAISGFLAYFVTYITLKITKVFEDSNKTNDYFITNNYEIDLIKKVLSTDNSTKEKTKTKVCVKKTITKKTKDQNTVNIYLK